MARLRFPGRPGCRFDRLGVRYGADEARNTNDPLTLFVANIHRGLRLFRELVGDSDEDDEFEGFTKEEVRLSEKKLQKELAKYRREHEGDISSPVSPQFGTRLSKQRESLENLPSAECTRNRKSTLIRKSYKEMINQGLGTPSKSYVIKKAKESASARSEVRKELKKWQKDRKSTESSQDKAHKKFKIRLDPQVKVRKIGNKRRRPSKFDESDFDDDDKSLIVDEIEEKGSTEKGKKKVKEKDKFSAVGKAKQLLQKAKTCKKDKVSPEQTKKKKVSARKQFVLPVLSSRSSRVIIPNKRFIEEDSENLGKSFPKRPTLKTDQSPIPAGMEPKLLSETGLFANASTKLQIETEKLPSLPISSLSPSGIVKPKFEALTDDGSAKKVYLCCICDKGMPAPRRRSGVLTCESCRRFFQVHTEKINQNQAFTCATRSCRIHYKEKPICEDCRYNKCLKFFNLGDRKAPSSSDQTAGSNDVMKEIHVSIPQITVSSASPSTSAPMSSPLGSLKSPSSLLSPMAASSPPVTMTTSSPETDDSPKSDGRGPRIKHVCRKAAVVLGKPVAKFPKSPEITLSALPSGEKVKLWKKDQEDKKELSDDELPMEDIIQQSEDNPQSVKKTPVRSPLKVYRGGRYGKRKIRCKKCEGCTSEDCGVCNYCLDKPKFGGRGVMKQACIQRRCKYPRYSRLGPGAQMRARESDNQSEGSASSPYKDTPSPGPTQQGRSQNDTSKGTSNRNSSLSVIQRMALQGKRLVNANKLNNDKSSGPFSEVLTPEDVSRRLWQEFGHAPQVSFPKFQSSSFGEGTRSQNSTQPKRMITKFKGPEVKSDTMIMHSVTTAGGWSAQGITQHRIKAEYRENFELTSVWYSGVSLTVSGPMCVRVICFLCGSAGKHEMLYCNVCCEPFHEFCLEEEERPHEINPDNWCCKRCQFCNVCGRQNNLLQCDKCQNTYHPECLGPNYPTKPSKKKNIWICTKCVKCKSCGATTPGSGSAATWTYDFQLCYECGQLMDKGNYCPICHKCYTDDDWDSKMVQCVSCESWVHARCEGLSDEMYERVSVLPEDVHYICKICSPKGPRHWELVLKDSFMDGLKSVFNTVTQAKCAQHLLHIDEKKAKELEDKLNEEKYGSALKTTIELEKSLENFVNSLEKVLKSKNKSGAIELQQQAEEKITEKGPSVVELVDGDKKNEKPLEDNDKDDSLIRFEGDEDLDETKSSSGEQQSDVEMAEVLNDSDTISIADGETLSAVTTPGVSRGVTPAGSPEAGSEGMEELPPPPEVSEDLPQKLRDVEAGVESGTLENIPKSTMLLSDEKDEVDGSKKENCEAIVSTVDSLEKEQTDVSVSVDVEMAEKTESRSNVCDNDNSVASPKLPSDDQNINLLDKEIKQEQIEENSQGNSSEGQSSTKTTNDVVDLTVEKSVSFLLSTPTKGLITPKKCSSVTDNRFLPGIIRSFPKDFNAVKIKLINEEYSSVNEFSEDMAHIINLALNDPDEVKLVRKKATNSVRSMFVKQMEKCFPWFNVKACQIWDQNQNFPPGMLPDAVLPPFEDHTYAQWLEREQLHRSPQPSPFKRVGNTPIKKIIPLPIDEDAEKVLSCDLEESGEDIRRCILCWHYGDSDPNDAGRLLYVGQDDWVHVNCALWSAEVYEEEHDGTLQNVQTALSRGRVMRCDSCQRAGATVGCCTRGCPANYHFMCARQELCLFQEDKKVFCPQHREKVDGELVAKEKFAVNRRVCVSMEDLKFNKKTWSKGLDPSNISVIIGSCTVEELGRLSPISDTKELLLPIEFSCTRVFWSTQDIRKRCVYTCQIIEVKPDSPKGASMVIKDTTIIHDETHPDFVPLSQINLPGINLFPEKRSRTESLEISHLSTESGFSKSFDSSGDCEILNSTMNISQNISEFDYSKDSLSSSWPIVRKRKKSDSCVNLGVLSPNTLKLLNLKDPEKFQQTAKTCKKDKEDFETLIKIADRLNMAAVGKTDKSKTFPQRQRSRSVDRLLSPPPVRFSPSFRSEGHQSAGNSRSNSRANSEERTFSPIPTMSLEKQLAMNKEVTSVKPLIDNNCNSQVTDLNKADVTGEIAEDRSTQGPEGGLEPINEEGNPEADLSNETYVVLPEGCSELSDEDMQMIAEAIERSRSEQGTDESMMSVESTEGASGKVDKEKSDRDVDIEVSAAETDSSSKEVQQNLSGTTDGGKVVDEAPERMQIDHTSEKEDVNLGLTTDITESIENGNKISSTVCSDSKGVDSELLVKSDILPMATNEEMGCENTELVNQVKETQEQMDISNDSKQSTLSDVNTTSKDTSITSEHEVGKLSTSNMFSEESGSTKVEEKVSEAGSQLCPTDVCEASTKKMETDMAVDISKESEVMSSLASSSREINVTKDSSENLDKVGTQTSDESLKAGTNVPSMSPPVLHSVQQRSGENVNIGTAKRDNKIPVYGREGHLIGYRTPNKSTLEHQELRRLHLTRKPTFEEILNEAQRQLQEEGNKTYSKMEEINKSQPLDSAEKSFVPASVGSISEKQEEDLHVCTEHQAETVDSKTGEHRESKTVESKAVEIKESKMDEIRTMESKTEESRTIESKSVESKKSRIVDSKTEEGKTEDSLNESLSSERNIFDILSANTEEPKSASSKLTDSVETNTNQDTEGKETEIMKENLDGISGPKDLSDGISEPKDLSETEEKQITTRRQSSESDKDRNIFTALESSFNSSKGQDSSDIDVGSVQDNYIPDTRTEEEKNNLFKGLGLARTPDAKKAKAELKKTPIKSYPLRRRSAQGGAASEDKRSDLPLHDQIAQKIKAESLAKSSPGDKGPFKCPTCKRLYRTVESFDTHVETCDFEVSTSDEEEESENEGGTRKYSMRQTTVVKKVVMEIEQKERESESAARKEKIHSTKPLYKKPRLILHKLSPRKIQQGNIKLSPRKRGRPPKTESKDISVKSELKGQKRLLSSDDEISGTENERKRRLSRHSSGGSVSSVRHSRSLSGGVKMVEDVKVEEDDTSPKRGRGRPRKQFLSPNEDKKQEEKSVVKEQSEESDLNRSISPKRGRGRPRRSSLLTEEDIKQEIISDELNSKEVSMFEESPKSTRGRGRPKKKSMGSEDVSSSSKSQTRSTRQSSSDHVCNESSNVSPKTHKCSQDGSSSGSGKKEELSGRSRKGLGTISDTQKKETRLKDKTALTNGRPVRLKKKVNLEYPGLSSLASKRNAILSRKIHSLRDSRIKQQKLKQVISMQGKKLERIVNENGVKRGRGRPRKYEVEKSRKTEDVQNKVKKNEKRNSDAQEKRDHSEHEKKETKLSVKDEETNKKDKLEEAKETPSGDVSTESSKKQIAKKRKSKTDIENSILNVIQQSNTSTLLKCPLQQVPTITDSEIITINDETSEDEVIFCEKTGDFLSRGEKNAAKSCETQCDFDSDLSPLKSDKSVVSTSSSLQISSTSKNVQAGNQKSPFKSETVREKTSSMKETVSNSTPASLSEKQKDELEADKNEKTKMTEKAPEIHINKGKETLMEDLEKELSKEDLGKKTSTEKFVDQIMNDPAIKQLTPAELLELQNKVTDKKVDFSAPSKVDTEATIKTIKEFLKKKIEEGTNKTMYVTDAGNVEIQGQSSSDQKSFSEPVSVMKINLPSSVTPQDIKKIIEAHKRATGTLGKSESSIGITPISRSSPLPSLMSQSTASMLSSTSASPQFSQGQSQQINPTVQTSTVPPNPEMPQSFGITAPPMSAANALLAAANAITPSSNPILPSPTSMMSPQNAIMPSPNTVISQSPQNLPALNQLLPSHPPAIQPAAMISQSAILPVGQQLSMMSPSAILPPQQTPLVTGGIQGPLYSVSNSTPGYQAISPAIMTVPEPPKTYLLPPNQNLITVPQSQNILNVPQSQLMTPNIPQQLDSYMLSLVNNSGIRVSQSLLNAGVSPVMNSTQFVQSVPQVQNITPLQNIPHIIQNMGFQNNTQQGLLQTQSTAQHQGPAIKTVPVNSQLQSFVRPSTSPVASNPVPPVSLPPSNPTIVRVFVDGKPIAMTTDASVLNDPTSFLAKLDPTALQRGRYNMSMTSHRVTSTTTLTVSTMANTTSLKTTCSPTTANKVLTALLKARTKVVSDPALHTSVTTKTPRGRPVKSTIPSPKKTIFRKLTKPLTSTSTVSSMACLSSGPSLSTNSMAIQAAPHTRLPPAMAQSRSLLPASFKSQREDTKSAAKTVPVMKISSTPEMVLNKPYIVRKADGTIVKKIIKTGPKEDFAIQPKVMKAIMKKLGGDKSLPILGKHGKGYEMLSVRVKSKAAVKAKEKRKRLRKSPQKVRMGLPQPSGTLSHPIIHPHKELMTLPQPALEEEVEETPYGQFQQEQQEKRLGKLKKDGPKFQFKISSDDGFSCKGDSMAEVWQQVIEKVQDLRSSARMKHLSFTSMDPTRLFGISYNPVVYLVEQLFGAQNCRNYNFKYHQYDMADLEEEPAENPSGCIRSEPFESRKPFDIFSFLMSQYRHMPGTCDSKNDVEMVHKSARRATSMDLPMAMRFRKLKEHSREAVGVYRSPIHGRGLFCKRNIDEGEMVIEYAGEVIRASLTDKREKYYEGKGIGCYMFRIDDFDVIDATLHGSAARFINHSCEPNCYSKVINVDGKKHIVIFAMTSIKRGEELTYDYKFPIEEVKIPCTCGAKKCRRYLN